MLIIKNYSFSEVKLVFVLRIVLILIGLLFISFGYSIWFKKKYYLINNFEKGKSNDSFAKRVGIIEFIGGIFCFVLGIISMFFDEIFTIVSFIVCIISIIVALIFNQARSRKNN